MRLPFRGSGRIDGQQAAQVIDPAVRAPFPGIAHHVLPLPGGILPFSLRRKPERDARSLGQFLEELLYVIVGDSGNRRRGIVRRTGVGAHDGLPEGLGDLRRADGVSVQDHLMDGRRAVAAHVRGLAHGERAGRHRSQREGHVLHRKSIKGIGSLPGRQVHGADRPVTPAGNRQKEGGHSDSQFSHLSKQARIQSCNSISVSPLTRRSCGFAPCAGDSPPHTSTATTSSRSRRSSQPFSTSRE